MWTMLATFLCLVGDYCLCVVERLGPDPHGVVTSSRHHELAGLVKHQTLHCILMTNQSPNLQLIKHHICVLMYS